MRNIAMATTALSVLTCMAACGDDESASWRHNDKPPPGQVTVLIVDEGIDKDLPVFEGKIAAGFTIACGAPPPTPDGGSAFPDPFSGSATADASAGGHDAGADDGGFDSDAMADGNVPMPPARNVKTALLQELTIPDDSCQLVPGLATLTPPLSDLEPQREAWNKKVRRDVDITSDPLLRTIVERAGQGSFHGSSTAGIIAHANRSVKLVLVNRTFASLEEVAASLGCPSQVDVDTATALLADPDVIRAYGVRPRGQAERALVQAMIDHRVNLVNESFGPLSRYGLELLLQASGCATPVDLRGYFAALGELTAAEEAYLPKPRALIVRAAGNEGAFLRDPGDAIECRTNLPHVSLVGSYGVVGEKSSFSNFGPCVDVFAPGEAVVGPVPGDWWVPQFGTSFAAPLVVRLLSMIMPNEPFDPAEARRRLHALRRPDNSIPRPNFPEELLYLPGLPSPLALSTAAAEEARPPLVTQEQLHRTVWPLQWLRRGRR